MHIMTRYAVTTIVAILWLFAAAHAQTFSGEYRLTTQWQGDGRAIAIINDGVNDRPHLADSANASGQYWTITDNGSGYYRLTCRWLGLSRSLTVNGTELRMDTTANIPAQLWKIASLGNGYYRLTAKSLGDSFSLDVVPAGANDKLRMANTGNYSGQFWKMSDTKKQTVPVAEDSKPISKAFTKLTIAGFTILVEPDKSDNDDTRQGLKILTQSINTMTALLQPSQVEKLRKVPVWIEYQLKTDGAIWYHPSADWLVSNGYPAEMARSIEIKCLRNFIDWQGDQPFMVFHEFAHAYMDLYLPNMQDEITTAYESAFAGRKYEKVPYVRGGTTRAYALNNKQEYFAELTEAYFGKNDFYPFNRAQLEEFDPKGYQLMQKAWR